MIPERPPTRSDGASREAPLRYTFAGGRFGAESAGQYARTLAEAAFWIGAASLPTRLLWRLGAHHASFEVQRWWARGVARTLLDIDWEGLDRIDPDETYIVTPLHEGLADVVALLQLPLPLKFVARDEFIEWRLLGPYLRDTEQVIIRPEAGTGTFRRMVREAGHVIDRGESLVVFPQGSILGIETDFLPGAFAIARILRRPILPIALTGSHRVREHPYSPRLRRSERVSVRVLPPIDAAEVRASGVNEQRQEVQRQLKGAALDGTMASPRHFVPAHDGYWDGYAYEIDPAFPELAADIAAHREGQDSQSRLTPSGCTPSEHGSSPLSRQ